MTSPGVPSSFPAPTLAQLAADPAKAATLPLETVEAILGQCSVVQGVLMNRLLAIRAGDAAGRGTGSARVDQGPQREYLSIRELAQHIPYTEGSIRNLMSQGKLRLGEHYLKPNGRVVFKWSAVRAWLDGAGQKAG